MSTVHGTSRSSVQTVQGAAEQIAGVHEGLGPEAAVVAAAAALLTLPATLGVLRRAAVSVTAMVLGVAGALQNPMGAAAQEVAR